MSKLRNVNQDARRKVKDRIQRCKSQEEPNEAIDSDDDKIPTTSLPNTGDKPRKGEFWKIRNGVHTLFSVISTEEPLTVKYFEAGGNYHILDDKEFEIFAGDLDTKVDPPETMKRGSRVYYVFE